MASAIKITLKLQIGNLLRSYEYFKQVYGGKRRGCKEETGFGTSPTIKLCTQLLEICLDRNGVRSEELKRFVSLVL